MGIKTPEEFEMVKQIARESSPSFLVWAVGRIANWDNKARPGNLVHIHGTADRIFPKHYNHADILVPGGGHLMAFSQADIISNLLIENISGGQ
jgi:hypothetical protein